MPDDRLSIPGLEVGPAQFMLDRFVIVLDPISEAVGLIDLAGTGFLQRQGGEQIPGVVIFEDAGIGRGGNESPVPPGSIGVPQFSLHDIVHQLLAMTVVAFDPLPPLKR